MHWTKQIQKQMSGLLVVLIFFVVSVQCCHLLMIQFSEASTIQSKAAKTMNCHSHSSSSESKKLTSEENKNTTDKICHCEINPGQIAWHTDQSLVDFSSLLYLAQELSFSTLHLDPKHINHPRNSSSRAPPPSIALHISSTILLI